MTSLGEMRGTTGTIAILETTEMTEIEDTLLLLRLPALRFRGTGIVVRFR